MKYLILIVTIFIIGCNFSHKNSALKETEEIPDTLYLLFHERSYDMHRDTMKTKPFEITSAYFLPRFGFPDFNIPFSYDSKVDKVYFKEYNYFENRKIDIKHSLWIRNKYISTDGDYFANYDHKRIYILVEEDLEHYRLKLTEVHFIDHRYRSLIDEWNL